MMSGLFLRCKKKKTWKQEIQIDESYGIPRRGWRSLYYGRLWDMPEGFLVPSQSIQDSITSNVILATTVLQNIYLANMIKFAYELRFLLRTIPPPPTTYYAEVIHFYQVTVRWIGHVPIHSSQISVLPLPHSRMLLYSTCLKFSNDERHTELLSTTLTSGAALPGNFLTSFFLL